MGWTDNQDYERGYRVITIPTLSEIYASMRADAQSLMESESPIPPLSLLNVLIAVFAGAMKLAYGHLYNVATWMLPDQAQGRFLSRLLEIYNIPISTGSSAEGSIVCTGTAGATIPTGATLLRVDGGSYITLVDGVIGSSGSSEPIPIQSTETGPNGNYNGTELTFQSAITNVNGTARVYSSCVGGSDADTEVDSRNKLLARIRTPNTIGVTSDYQRIALSVDGVGRVWSQGGDFWTGPNTVAVTVATSDNTPVSASALSNVQSKMVQKSNLQPGIVVGVYNLVEEPVEIRVEITPDTTGYRDNVDTAVAAFFRDGINPGEMLKIADIRSAITMSGVDNYHITGLVIDGVTYEPQDIQASTTAFKKFSDAGVVYV